MGFPRQDIPNIVNMIQAKREADYAKADKLRDELKELGYEIRTGKRFVEVNYPLGLASVTIDSDDMSMVYGN